MTSFLGFYFNILFDYVNLLSDDSIIFHYKKPLVVSFCKEKYEHNIIARWLYCILHSGEQVCQGASYAVNKLTFSWNWR